MPGTVFFSRAPRSKWVFLVTVPHTLLYGPALRTALFLGAGMLLLLALGALAALSAARRISQPVEALREAAERLGHNEHVEPGAFGTGRARLGEPGHGAGERAAARYDRRA